MEVCGITPPFGGLSPASGQVAYVLLDRSPLSTRIAPCTPFDLHFSGTPQAFVLSQDQTLHQKIHLLPLAPLPKETREAKRKLLTASVLAISPFETPHTEALAGPGRSLLYRN